MLGSYLPYYSKYFYKYNLIGLLIMKKNFLALGILISLLLPTYLYADNTKKGDVIMIANGDYDVFIETTEEEFTPIVKELGIKIGGTKIVGLEYLDNLISKFKPIKTSFGGSAANTAYTLSSLGKNNGIYVVLSDEKIAEEFIEDLEQVGVKNYGEYISKEDRGQDSVMTKVASFISNSKTHVSERTFVAYKGLSTDFSKVKFDLSHIKDYKILYIEGYVFSPKSKNIIFEAIKEAKRHKVKILFAPSSPFFVNAYKKDFQKIIALSDIIFTNHGELEAFYQNEEINQAIKKLSKKVDIAIVTNGKNGSVISYNHGKHMINIDEAIDQSKVIDTTGAGDGYLAGFLYGYLNGCDMETSGKIGARIANHVIQEISGRPSQTMLRRIKDAIYRKHSPH